jgi:hypothetical protein
MVKPAAGVTDQALAAELQGQYLPEGLVATQIRDQSDSLASPSQAADDRSTDRSGSLRLPPFAQVWRITRNG